MDTLDPLIEGYLAYLSDVGRKAPRTVIDVRCTLRRAIVELEGIRPGIHLWKRSLECQRASNIDQRSASNFDHALEWVSGSGSGSGSWLSLMI